VEEFEVRLIGLDSVIQGAAGGELCKLRLAWLDARLQEAKDRPTIIFMHHPPVKFGVLETDVDGFVGADLLGDIIEKHPNIEQIMCGHIHLLAHARWRGTVISTAPSTGMQLALDLTMQRPSEFFLEAPGYRLHHWTSHKCLTTHTIYVREPDGPYLFE
jgi:3',5'-cyclic AMP phosphodiesterase CpdA